MTNIKYSKRFKLRNGERIDFCPECDYHITDTVNNSDSVYCPKCGQQIQLFKPALCPKDCDFLKKHQYLGKFFCLAHKNGEKEIGGYVGKEDNLAQDGDARVYGNARVCGNA